MGIRQLACAIAFVTLALSPAWAADPAPAGSTGLCKDGSYTESATKKGACSDHGGVKKWYGKAAASKKAAKDEAKADAKADAKAEARAKSNAEARAKSKSSKSAEKTAQKEAAARTETASRKEAPARKETTAREEPAPRPMPSARNEMPAAGGGAGKVWVNTDSHVYHCAGDRWYGKTKKGEYLSESEARAQGNRADHGKACG